RRANAVHVALEPVDRPRARRGEHEIVQENRVQQTAPELEPDDGAVAYLKSAWTRKGEVDVIPGILAGGAGEGRAVGGEHVPIRARERRANVSAGPITRRRRRGEVADDEGPAVLVGNHLGAPIVADLEQLEVIDVMC